MSDQITNNTPFNIYYSDDNIPYTNSIRIGNAKNGILICKDQSTYNLLFVNGLGYTYLLSDDVNKFSAYNPIQLELVNNNKERVIKLSYEEGFLTVSNKGLTVNKAKFDANYADKQNTISYIDQLTTKINKLTSENTYLSSQIELLNRKFNALNIDKEEYTNKDLNIYLNSENGMWVREKDKEDISFIYDNLFSKEITLNLYSTYSIHKINNYNWNDRDNYRFIKHKINIDDNGIEIKEDCLNECKITIKDAYFDCTNSKKYYYTLNDNDTPSYFTDYKLTSNTIIGDEEILNNVRESYTYNLSTDSISINGYDKIDLSYFSGYTFADFPFDYNEKTRTFNIYNYKPVNYLPINTIDNYYLYNQTPNKLKVRYTYLTAYSNSNGYHEEYGSFIIDSNTISFDLPENVKRLKSLKIYPIVNDDKYGINSNLKLSLNSNASITIKETTQNYVSTSDVYRQVFDNVSCIEFKFPEKSYENKIQITLKNLYLSGNFITAAINKEHVIITTTTSTLDPNSTTTTSTLDPNSTTTTSSTSSTSSTTSSSTPEPSTPEPSTPTPPPTKFRLQIVNNYNNGILMTRTSDINEFNENLENLYGSSTKTIEINDTYNMNWWFLDGYMLKAAISTLGNRDYDGNTGEYYFKGTIYVSNVDLTTSTPQPSSTTTIMTSTTSTLDPNSTTTTSSTSSTSSTPEPSTPEPSTPTPSNKYLAIINNNNGYTRCYISENYSNEINLSNYNFFNNHSVSRFSGNISSARVDNNKLYIVFTNGTSEYVGSMSHATMGSNVFNRGNYFVGYVDLTNGASSTQQPTNTTTLATGTNTPTRTTTSGSTNTQSNTTTLIVTNTTTLTTNTSTSM